MVFIPFTRIDNHFKCVTFGGGLLTKEDLLSYEWLLKSFKIAYPREPKLLLTDQDPAMKQAINSCFVNARHRLCMWHITEKLTSKVNLCYCIYFFIMYLIIQKPFYISSTYINIIYIV